jgi:rod shape-determining protein MreD
MPPILKAPSLQRVDNALARLLPLLTTLLATLLSVMPVRIPGYAALTPAFTLMAVYHWTIYRPDLLPTIALFAVGLAQDLLSGGPLGVSALLYLLVRATVISYRSYFVGRLFPFVWGGFTVLTVGALLFLWAVHCAFYTTLLDLRGTVFRAVLTIAIFPVASLLLGRTQRALMGAG